MQTLHRRVAEREAALRESAPEHLLLGNTLDSTPVHERYGNETGDLMDIRTGGRVGNYGYLIVGEDSERSQYYGSASSLHLSVSW